MLNKEFVEHPLIKKESVQKRVYQELLTAKAIDQSTLVVAPTGLGKTIIAVLLIAYTYNKNKSIIFLAPTKPLISQHQKSLLKVLNIPSEKILLLTGNIPAQKRKKYYEQEGLIICATPQTIRNDIQNKLISKNNFNLLIFDEAHRAVGNYAYVEISSFFPETIKRLALTASPGSRRSKIQEVADNLKIKHIEIKTEDDIDVVDYIKNKEIETVFIEPDSLSIKISNILESYILKKIEFLRKFNFKIPNSYTKKQIIQVQASIFERIKKSKKSIWFIALSTTSSLLKVFHAKELIETQGFYALKSYLDRLFLESKDPNVSKTIKSVIHSKEVLEVYKLLINNIDHAVYSKERELISIVNNYIKNNPKSKILIFNNFRDNAAHLVTVLNKNKLIKSARFVGQATKGVADKGLSQKEQIQIITDFKNGVYNNLVCTSVGEEGLDIPSVDLVVFYDAVASEIRSIQRRGRTGRFNVGKVILLLNKGTIDEHYYYVSMNKEQRMKKVLNNFNNRPLTKSKTKKKQKTILDY